MQGRGGLVRSRDQVGADYDRLSVIYGWLAEPWERRPRRLALQLLAVKPGERVLELGIGAGVDLRALGARAGGAFGLDRSKGMLHHFRRGPGGGRSHDIALIRADAQSLPIRSACFDVVYASFTLELFAPPGIAMVLAESRRILRRGGRLGLVSLSRLGAGRLSRLYEGAHNRWPGVIDCLPILAAEAVRAAGLEVQRERCQRMWGLPVEVVIASNSA